MDDLWGDSPNKRICHHMKWGCGWLFARPTRPTARPIMDAELVTLIVGGYRVPPIGEGAGMVGGDTRCTDAPVVYAPISSVKLPLRVNRG